MLTSPNLGPDLEDDVKTLVRSGRYQSRDEVSREEIEVAKHREKRLDVLDASITRGVADAEAGRVRPVQEVAQRLKARSIG